MPACSYRGRQPLLTDTSCARVQYHSAPPPAFSGWLTEARQFPEIGARAGSDAAPDACALAPSPQLARSHVQRKLIKSSLAVCHSTASFSVSDTSVSLSVRIEGMKWTYSHSGTVKLGLSQHRPNSAGSEASPSVDTLISKRRLHLLRTCSKMNKTAHFRDNHTVNTERNFFLDYSHHLVYCAVEKVGSSFWKRAFKILNNMAPNGSLFDQSGLSVHANSNEAITFENKPEGWKRNTLNQSLKFLFVRDPYAKLFSAYMDKIFIFFGGRNGRRGLRRAGLVSSQRENQSEGKCTVSVPTFSEFVNAMMLRSTALAADGHFTPIEKHCLPCEIRYDVIGKMETFRRDTEYILGKVGHNLTLLSNDPLTFDTKSDLNIMTDILRRIMWSPAWQESEDCTRSVHFELLRRMWTVFKVRGILSANVTFPFSRGLMDTISEFHILQELQHAYRASGSREARLLQREAAMLEAFRTLSNSTMQALFEFVKPDCELFDYQCLPSERFSGKGTPDKDDSSYFGDYWNLHGESS
ncbi:hypothetical protein BaRGS_00034905 [Batillaria attramentaria]|uniref:Carbohydrate sulfotransferase n=1 Tax=Batillaria attramentaria TaxID=370345 RepID=A0ABD0JG12_9CAEN